MTLLTHSGPHLNPRTPLCHFATLHFCQENLCTPLQRKRRKEREGRREGKKKSSAFLGQFATCLDATPLPAPSIKHCLHATLADSLLFWTCHLPPLSLLHLTLCPALLPFSIPVGPASAYALHLCAAIHAMDACSRSRTSGPFSTTPRTHAPLTSLLQTFCCILKADHHACLHQHGRRTDFPILATYAAHTFIQKAHTVPCCIWPRRQWESAEGTQTWVPALDGTQAGLPSPLQTSQTVAHGPRHAISCGGKTCAQKERDTFIHLFLRFLPGAMPTPSSPWLSEDGQRRRQQEEPS